MHSSSAAIDNELARQLWEAAPAIVLVLDQQGRVLRVNPFFQEFTGFDLADVIGRDWIAEFLPERCRGSVREVFEETLKGPSATGVITPIVTRSGEERIVEWHNRVLDTDAAQEVAVFALGFDVTERVKAETELRKSQAQLNEAQRLARIGSWRLDLRDDTLAWSDEIFRIFEIDPARFAASYEAFLDAVHPDDRELVNRAYTESVESREPYDIVHRLRLTSGLTKWVHERCETRYDEYGEPIYSTGTVQDITDQVLAQRALKESQSAYRRLHDAARLKEGAVEATPNAIAFWTFDGTVSYVNPTFVRMWGYAEPDEVIGRSITELVTDAATAEQVIARAQKGEPASAEVGARRKDGEELMVHFAVSILRDEKGAPVQFMGACMDVTERTRIERKVRRARDLLRSAVDQSPDWIFAEDLEHRFVLVNEAFAKAWDRAPRQILGHLDTELWSRDWAARNPGRSLEQLHHDDRRAFRGETVHIPHDSIVLADGRPRVFDTWKVPLRDEAGAIRGLLCYSRDVTSQWEDARGRKGRAQRPSDDAGAPPGE